MSEIKVNPFLEGPATRKAQKAQDELKKTTATISEINATIDANYRTENPTARAVKIAEARRKLKKPIMPEEIDVAFEGLEETSAQRAERLHQENKGQTLEVPPEVRKAS
jgi:hypothetical protein